MDVEGTACATGLLLGLLADVWRALHRNTSNQKNEISCLKQQVPDRSALFQRKESTAAITSVLCGIVVIAE